MPHLVAILGKPCTGKSTQGEILERRLNDAGILAIDATREAAEHSFLIKTTKRLFGQGELSISAVVAESAITFAATDLRATVLKHKEGYRNGVIILERLLSDATTVRLSSVKEYSASRPLFRLSAPLTRKPELIFYQCADRKTLERRFDARATNKDPAHRSMLLCLDKGYIELLAGAMRDSRIVLVNANGSVNRIADEIFAKTIENLGLTPRK